MLKTNALHELNEYKDSSFPVGMYTVSIDNIVPKGRGVKDLHWHKELQFTLVTSGRMSIQIYDKTYVLEAGEAIFINCGLLHMTTELTSDGEYVSFNFPDKILGFFTGSRMEQKCVLPFTKNSGLKAFHFKANASWEAELINGLYQLKKMMIGQSLGIKEYEVSILLVTIWLKLIENIKGGMTPSKSIDIKKHKRLQSFIAFIHTNYSEDIKLIDIASASYVSVGECGRCFKSVLHITPYEYLLNYRISQSMQLLNDSDATITEIARSVGFNSVSHFIKHFKKRVAQTPSAYRHHTHQ